MLRNEVLSNVEMAEQELTYLIGIRDATGDKKVSGAELTSTETLEDITDFLDKALAALDSDDALRRSVRVTRVGQFS